MRRFALSGFLRKAAIIAIALVIVAGGAAWLHVQDVRYANALLAGAMDPIAVAESQRLMRADIERLDRARDSGHMSSVSRQLHGDRIMVGIHLADAKRLYAAGERLTDVPGRWRSFHGQGLAVLRSSIGALTAELAIADHAITMVGDMATASDIDALRRDAGHAELRRHADGAWQRLHSASAVADRSRPFTLDPLAATLMASVSLGASAKFDLPSVAASSEPSTAGQPVAG